MGMVADAVVMWHLDLISCTFCFAKALFATARISDREGRG
jgi:hypothetical protein